MAELSRSKGQGEKPVWAVPTPDVAGAVLVSEGVPVPPSEATVPKKKLGPRDAGRAAHLKRWRFEKGCKSPNPSGRPRNTVDRFEAAVLEASWRALLKFLENPWRAADPVVAKTLMALNRGLIKRMNEKHRNEGLEDGHPSLAEGDPVVVKFLMPPLPPKPEVPKEALVPGTISPGPEGQIE